MPLLSRLSATPNGKDHPDIMSNQTGRYRRSEPSMRQTLLLRRHFGHGQPTRRPRHFALGDRPWAARRCSRLRSHNSLLYDCQSANACLAAAVAPPRRIPTLLAASRLSAFAPTVALIADVRECTMGGGDRDRTDDLLLAKQVLSQLSYTPVPRSSRPATGSAQDRPARHSPIRLALHLCRPKLVGQGGFEPPTSRLSSARSNQLSY